MKALVTGASRGIGRGIALALKAAGYHVIGVSRPSDALDSLAADGIETWALDATSDALLDRIAALDGLDLLVNNLGTARHGPFAETSDEDLDRVLDTNLRATLRITRTALGVMQDGSGIVTVTSQMGHVGAENRTVYCATKFALEGMTKALAVELAPRGIRVNAVAPTFVETPLTRPMLDDPDFRAWVMDRLPLGRLATVEDVAGAVVYLAGAGSVTGHSLLVDGGWTAR